jgi:hypothetical protein
MRVDTAATTDCDVATGLERTSSWYSIGLAVVRSNALLEGEEVRRPAVSRFRGLQRLGDWKSPMGSSMTSRGKAIPGPALSRSFSAGEQLAAIAIAGIIPTISEDVPGPARAPWGVAISASGLTGVRPASTSRALARCEQMARRPGARAPSHAKGLHPMFSRSVREPRRLCAANPGRIAPSADAVTTKGEGNSLLLASRLACATPPQRCVARTDPSQDHLLTFWSYELPARLGAWRQRPSRIHLSLRGRSRRDRSRATSRATQTASAVRAPLARPDCGLAPVIQGVRLFERPLAPFPRQ